MNRSTEDKKTSRLSKLTKTFSRPKTPLMPPKRPKTAISLSLKPWKKEKPAGNTSSALYNEEEIDEYRQVFSMFDTDESGSIGVSELRNALQRLGITMDDGELDDLIKEVDEDQNGQIDFEEFCGVMKRMTQKHDSWDETVRACFEVFEPSLLPTIVASLKDPKSEDERGFITEATFRHILKTLGDILDDDVIDLVFDHTDVDKNGKIDYCWAQTYIAPSNAHSWPGRPATG